MPYSLDAFIKSYTTYPCIWFVSEIPKKGKVVAPVNASPDLVFFIYSAPFG